MGKPDSAMRTLMHLRNTYKKGEVVDRRSEFCFYQIGGSGQIYTPQHVELMREIMALGGKIHGFTCGLNGRGETAILMAAGHNDYDFMVFLMENGANPYKQRYEGKCAFNYADKIGYSLLEHYLKKRVAGSAK